MIYKTYHTVTEILFLKLKIKIFGICNEYYKIIFDDMLVNYKNITFLGN